MYPNDGIMADDIDELLDEVESKFIKKPLNSKCRTAGTKAVPSMVKDHAGASNNTSVTGSVQDPESRDFSDLINDIPSPEHLGKGPNWNALDRNHSLKDESSTKKKCFPLYLGGSEISFGLSSSLSERACNNIRCTACDFKVSIFMDFRWDKSTDHIFLRNNMPDFDRLKSKLRSHKGSSAYSCQCHCVSVQFLTAVKKLETCKWVCGGH